MTFEARGDVGTGPLQFLSSVVAGLLLVGLAVLRRRDRPWEWAVLVLLWPPGCSSARCGPRPCCGPRSRGWDSLRGSWRWGPHVDLGRRGHTGPCTREKGDAMQIVTASDRADLDGAGGCGLSGEVAGVHLPRPGGPALHASCRGVFCQYDVLVLHDGAGRRRLGRAAAVGRHRRRPTGRVRLDPRPQRRGTRVGARARHVELHGCRRGPLLRPSRARRRRARRADRPGPTGRHGAHHRPAAADLEAPLPAGEHGRLRQVDAETTVCR